MVMGSPLALISRFKVLPAFWKHSVDKNNYLSGRGEEGKQSPNVYRFGGAHCGSCGLVVKGSVGEVEGWRGQMLQGRGGSCFNAMSLLRLRWSALGES